MVEREGGSEGEEGREREREERHECMQVCVNTRVCVCVTSRGSLGGRQPPGRVPSDEQA